MPHAWIENGAVRDVCHGVPSECYHPDIAKFYDTQVPEGTANGATLVEGVWTNPAPPPEPAPYTPPEPSPEQLREAAKAARQAAVEAITVTTAAGNTFDGDETSQTRMARAILVLSTGAATAVPWVLADNTVITADIAELTEALALAGAEQARFWVL